MTTTYATGVKKLVTIAQETTYGVQSVASGQQLRRVTADFNLNVAQVQSQEILPSQQVRDARQGPRQVQGQLTGQLSPATFKLFFQGLFRNNFVAGVNTATLTDTVATIDGPTGNFVITGASETFLTTGFKTGDICRFSNLTSGAAADNAENLRLLTATQTVLTFAPPVVTPAIWASGQSAVITVTGKKLTVPVTNQLDTSYTIEQWYSDIGLSEIFTGMKVTQVTFNVPASGFVTFTAQLIGQQMTTGSSQIYASATAASSTISLTANGGRLVYGGLPQAAVSSFSLQIISDASADPVVGTNLIPNVFIGTLRAQGSMTALMQSDRLNTDFLNEVEVEMSALMTTSAALNADFVSLYLPRCKLMTNTRQDSDRQINRSFNLQALEQASGAANVDATTVVMQDSLA